MTKRERFLAFANFEPVDRVPRRASYVPALHETLSAHLGAPPEARFDTDAGCGAKLLPPAGYQPPDFSHYFPEYADNPDFEIDANGCGHLKSGFYHFHSMIGPLRHATTFKEIEVYPFPTRHGWCDDQMRRAADDARASGDFTWTFVGHIYEYAWQVRGYENFLVDLLTNATGPHTFLTALPKTAWPRPWPPPATVTTASRPVTMSPTSVPSCSIPRSGAVS